MILGCPNAVAIGNRGEAIRKGIVHLEPGDVLLIAGKGHETFQIVGNEKFPFDDRIVAAQIIQSMQKPI